MTSPLVFDVNTVLRGSGNSLNLDATGPAPERIGLNMVAFDKDAPLSVNAHFTPLGGETLNAYATIAGPITVHCGRCLETFTVDTTIDVNRVYTSDPNFVEGDGDASDDEGIETITGTNVDLTQALIDEAGLSWPFSPVCEDYGRECNNDDVPAPDGESGKDEKNLLDPRWAGLEKFK
ncbi:YceD family protein [Corynebacterium aquilae]|uniref:DNA-binding protein n=1 Tax=Corynebacterium aquilae DSM 44791 TaxID=1431546 RepID=A0A1L7CGS1_9CORY|nr:DUF177 domain-containing protein [Corynebacterium aquilae]APT85036.1 hypothetical protein CAQU_08065 [Corynebacterium aquilae DSM 44791]